MAQQTVCDNCGKASRDHFAWWTLESFDVNIGFGEGEQPFAFCTLACVGEFAAKHAEDAESRLRPYPRYTGSDTPPPARRKAIGEG